MNLKETIIKMKKNEKTFEPMIESMKRKADKGLLEGITRKDIDDMINILEKEEKSPKVNVLQEMNEIEEISEKDYKYLLTEDDDIELLEGLVLFNITKKIDSCILKEDDWSDDTTASKVGKGIGAAAAGTAAVGGIYHLGKAVGHWDRVANIHRGWKLARHAWVAANPGLATAATGALGLAVGARRSWACSITKKIKKEEKGKNA